MNRLGLGWILVVCLALGWRYAALSGQPLAGLFLVLVVAATAVMSWLQLGVRPPPTDVHR
jgi:hypothetical protein